MSEDYTREEVLKLKLLSRQFERENFGQRTVDDVVSQAGDFLVQGLNSPRPPAEPPATAAKPSVTIETTIVDLPIRTFEAQTTIEPPTAPGSPPGPAPLDPNVTLLYSDEGVLKFGKFIITEIVDA